MRGGLRGVRALRAAARARVESAVPAEIPPHTPAASQNEAASSPGISSGVHAVTAQREAARRSFDSQRAALLETIEKQRRTMCESAAQALRPSAQGTGANLTHCSEDAWARLSAVCDAGDRLVMSLALMGGVPGMSGSEEAQAQGAVAARRFLAALRALIAEEVAKAAIAADPENQ